MSNYHQTRIAVLAADSIPSGRAHSINLVKHAEAFERIGAQIKLFASITKRNLRSVLSGASCARVYGVPNLKVVWAVHPSAVFEVRVLRRFRKPVPTSEQRVLRLRREVAKAVAWGAQVAYTRRIDHVPTLLEYRLPFIYETHDRGTASKPNASRILQAQNAGLLAGIVTLGESIAEEWHALGIDKSKTLVLPDAVDTTAYPAHPLPLDDKQRIRRKFGLPENRVLLMYTGSFRSGKGVKQLIDLSPRMTAHLGGEASVVLVGGTQDECVATAEYARNQGVGNVLVLGRRTHRETAELQTAADALLLLYDQSEDDAVMDYETTSPIKMFEYMAAGVPIIATGLPNIRRVLTHRRNAYLSAEDNGDLGEVFRQAASGLGTNEAHSIAQTAMQDARRYTYTNRCTEILNRLTG